MRETIRKFLQKHGDYFGIGAILLSILIFFYPVILEGKNAIPADTIAGLYSPMRDATFEEYPNGPPYKNYLITDAVRQQYPWRQFAIEQLQKGEFPWWNPYNFSGSPLFANFQSAVLYPLNVVYWLMDFTSGWNLQVILQQILGGIFLFLYLRNLKLHTIAATFGSLVWMFSGFTVAWLEWNMVVHIAAWSPLILLSIDKILEIQSKRIIWSGVLLIGLVSQLYAGYPQPWIYLSFLQAMYLIWRWWQHRDFSKLIPLTTVYSLFGLLSSPLIIRALQFSKLSNRTFDQGNVLTKPDWFIPYQNLIQVIVPDFFGNPATLNYWGIFNYTEFVSFIGIVAAVMVVGLWLSRKKSPETKFFTIMLLVALGLSLRNPISELQFSLNLPFIGSSQPSRWIVVIDLCLAILAAIGLNRFIKGELRVKSAWIMVALVLGGAWIATLQLPYDPATDNLDRGSVTQRNLVLPTVELLFVGIVLGMLVLANKCKSRINKIITYSDLVTLSAVGLVCLSTISGLRFGWKFTPFTDDQWFYPQSEILTYLQQNQDLYRYSATDAGILTPNMNLAYRLYSIEGYDPLYLRDYARLVYATETDTYTDNSKPYNRVVRTDEVNSPVLNLLGVKHILSYRELNEPHLMLIMEEGNTKLYENKNVLPRAFIIDPTTELMEVSEVTPATIEVYTPNLVVIKANTAGLLVLSDAWYPNWSARLDGTEVEVQNWYGLRATMVPEGAHELVFEYRYP